MKHNYYFFYIIALNILTQPQWNIKQQQWRKMKSSLLVAGNKNMGLWLMMRLNNWFGEIVPPKELEPQMKTLKSFFSFLEEF